VVPGPDDVVGGMMRNFIESGMDPTEVADAVLAAIVENRFYILTHGDSGAAVTARAEAIANGTPPPFVMPQ